MPIVDAFPAYSVCLSLECNPHVRNGDNVAEWIDCMVDEIEAYEWAGGDEHRLDAFAADEVWTLQWHPRTSVGSRSVAGAYLETVLAMATDADTLTPSMNELVAALPVGFRSFSISHNSHRGEYEAAKNWVEEQEDLGYIHWVSDEQRRLALEKDSIWTFSAYDPETADYSKKVAAASLEVLLDAVRAMSS